MRIVYIGGEPVPGNTGGSTHFMEVAAGLAQLGHEILAVCPRDHGQQASDVINGVRIIRVPMKMRKYTIPLAALLKLFAILRFKPDILMERFVTFGGTLALIARITRTPLVLEINSPHTDELLYRFKVKNRILRWLLLKWRDFQMRSATRIIATLSSVVPPFVKERVMLVDWAANCDLFDNENIPDTDKKALRKKLGIRPDQPVVIFLGTFRAWHGVHHLPVIAAEVLKKIPDACFVTIGAGNERAAVELAVKDAGLTGSFIFTGSLPYTTVPLYLSIGDVGIAPYDRSAYPPLIEFGFYWSPLKIFEYMACGLPVVTIDVEPLNRLVKDGERGFVVPEGNWSIFSQKIVQLLNDRAASAKMGRDARSYTQSNYSWQYHVAQLNEMLLSLNTGT
ncbi:MAG: glycosyltransferase WbuB [Candidatus Auribacter fodinae]|jgi:glycosyltransferase involved in cell wall biosynthesis|uniref:Glycosyltransferase WbuB n=1 Tax=Candidatus Auribacter fodinae TaxID=2093366 RepID=A0A3A4R999_9BACT|nr:MAG: glycosyltransferase WbuB [Candidatus Auribacter fodinae]